MARASNPGASVEIVVKNGEPRIQLVRGSSYSPEILTRDQAAKLVEQSWASLSARDCSGDCWLCLLNEAVEEFR